MCPCTVDLVVDWIHDKLYWSDSEYHRIEEIDIITLERKIVMANELSSPLGLALYPLEDQG